MVVRKGNNLLEQALRIAQSSGRSHQVRLNCLLRMAARTLALTSAKIYLPDPPKTYLSRRFGTTLPHAGRSCLIPFDAGCA
ncbi:MAG TPA: diguanylate cyclase, partial [Geobacter sp.]|nr:diguanylate cyclase [Geobacter sp.]